MEVTFKMKNCCRSEMKNPKDQTILVLNLSPDIIYIYTCTLLMDVHNVMMIQLVAVPD